MDRAEAEESEVIEDKDLAALERVADDDATLEVKAAAASELDRAALAALTSMATMEMSNRDMSNPEISQYNLVHQLLSSQQNLLGGTACSQGIHSIKFQRRGGSSRRSSCRTCRDGSPRSDDRRHYIGNRGEACCRDCRLRVCERYPGRHEYSME